MPFMKGKAPIRRTIQYLSSSNLVLKEFVKIFSINYNTYGENHKGAQEFAFWHLCQIQYKNPLIQCITFKNLTPTPFIRLFLENGEEVFMDVDNKSRTEITDHLKKVICKSDERLQFEKDEAAERDNPANFGWGCDRQCICEIPGQVPCSGLVPLPKFMRGKYKYGLIVE